MRRTRWARGLATVTVAVLVACSGDGGAEPATTTAADAATDTDSGASGADDSGASGADAATAFPLTVTHAYGETTLEARPERVVTLGWLESDVVVALGIEPVAVSEFPFTDSSLSPWLEAAMETTPETIETAGRGNERADLAYERIIALDPDLIIATTYVDLVESYDLLSDIAPVLGPSEADYTHIPWADQAEAIGEALGLGDEARQLVEDTEAEVADRAQPPAGLDGATYTLALGTPDALRVVQDPDDAGPALLDRFGLVMNPAVADLPSLDDGSGGASVSEENVDVIDADIVMVAYILDAAQGRWEDSELFQSVPAVADGRYIALDTTTLAGIRNPSPLSLPYTVDAVATELEAVAA